MLNPGQIHVWRICLIGIDEALLPAASAGESARAARFYTEQLSRRYLASHRALRAILAKYTAAQLNFAVTPTGKPYLPGARELKFNLAHSQDMALVAVTLDQEVGVDIEQHRTITDYESIANRFFPPREAGALSETPEPERKAEFFRRWTRFEAMLKARGVGLYGAGQEIGGEWTVEDVPSPPGFSAAVAVERPGMGVTVRDFGADE